MGCTPNKQEERLTAKGVGANLLFKVRQLRKALQEDLGSLKYLNREADGNKPNLLGKEAGQLVIVEDHLAVVETRLRLLGGA